MWAMLFIVSLIKVSAANYDQPLFLTPIIYEGNIKEAQLNAKVPPFKSVPSVESYSGFLTVNETYNSNMFFWFFPAEINPDSAPLVLWLQGGPGVSSLFALFEENGPYQWTTNNPVGVGYSFTESPEGYAKNEDDVSANIYNALIQFLTLFPHLQKNDFYISAESYGCKYSVSTAYLIDLKNPTAKLKINLKGLSIGNGDCDPEYMLNYGEYLYQIGLVDSKGRSQFDAFRDKAVKFINNKQFTEAFQVFDEIINGDITPFGTLFNNLTGITNFNNYLQPNNVIALSYTEFLEQNDVRRQIHVGNLPYNATTTTVEMALIPDIMQSVKPMLEILIWKDYQILIYNGQLDVILTAALTDNYVRTIDFKEIGDFNEARRDPWILNNELVGYSKSLRNFHQVVVLGAGHLVPMDKPDVAFALITDFLKIA